MDSARHPFYPDAPSARATLKAHPEDFVVTETLGFEPSGRGEHLFFWIEKRQISTHEVAVELAEHLNLPRRAISYSGRKDKQAVCRQWFSAHRPGIDRPRIPDHEHWQVLQATRNQRHLRVGTHKANGFDVLLRDPIGELADLPERFARLQKQGTPNYFGPQRFGHNNLERALAGYDDEMALAAARAAMFNRMLSARVERGDWLTPADGEPWLRIDGNGWVRENIDPARCDPCLPLYGPTPGIPDANQAAWRDEFASHSDLDAVLSSHRWQPHRRRTRLRPSDAQLAIEPDGIRIQATLPTGAFMTSVISALIETDHANSD